MHFVSCGLTLLSVGLAVTRASASTSTLAQPQPQSSLDCDPLFGRIDAGHGGRKIGIVIDASTSMQDNDRSNLRLQAAKLLVNKLVASADATSGRTADQVAVVQFTSFAKVVYPLGDPRGAAPSIDRIPSSGGTFIGGGIRAAVKELTKTGNGPTDQTGILVLTDGREVRVKDTIASIEEAQKLGIRVSFGFLSVDSSQQDSAIISAILRSGGTFTTIKIAEDVAKLVAQALLNGLVAAPRPGGGGIDLLPGLNTSALFSQTSSNTFLYAAQAGETFNVTVTAIDSMSLKVTLREAAGKADIASAVTNASGVAFLEHTTPSAVNVTIEVTSNSGPASGLFSVQIGSSLDPCKGGATPSPSPSPSATATATNATVALTPTSTGPLFTAAAVPMYGTAPVMKLALLLLPAIFGALH